MAQSPPVGHMGVAVFDIVATLTTAGFQLPGRMTEATIAKSTVGEVIAHALRLADDNAFWQGLPYDFTTPGGRSGTYKVIRDDLRSKLLLLVAPFRK